MKNIAAVAGALFAVALALSPMLARGGAFRDLESHAVAPQEPILVPAAEARARAAAARPAPAGAAPASPRPRLDVRRYDRIVAGEVTDINEGPNPRPWMSKRSAHWEIATVAVSDVIRGGPVQFAQVWFSDKTPRLSLGEKGVWLLSACKGTRFGRCRPGGYMAFKPKDVQPLSRLRDIETAVKS